MDSNKTPVKSTEPGYRISVCIIAKNEEANIERCLKSVEDIAHEIIVVDTGSTDKTKRIASKYARVYDFKWQDDFSKARNESLKYVSGDWVLIIDADEELTEKTREYIFPFLESQPYKDEPVAFSLKILEPHNIIFKTVLFKAGHSIHFVKPLHEHPYRENDSLITAKADFLTIVHSSFKNSTKDEIANKNKKYIYKLLKIIKESARASDKSYFSYHLGNAYLSNEQLNNAFKAYQDGYNYYKQSGRNKKAQLYGNLILCQLRILVFNKKKYKEALQFIEELLEISPGFPDALFFQAYCHQYMGNYARAIQVYESIIQLLGVYHPDKLDPLGINSLQDFLYINVMIELARCYIVTGNKERALFYLNNAYLKNKNIPELLTILTMYYFLEDDLSKIIYYYDNNKINLSDKDRDYLVNVSKLPFSDIRYKKALSAFLKMLEESKTDWLKEELKLIRDKLKELETVKISVFVLSQNQEKYIDSCLRSVLPLADQITLIDLGSTDNTRELADKYSAVQVLEIKSKEDSEIRILNHLLETSTGDWTFLLNGNEVLAEFTRLHLLNYLNKLPEESQKQAFVFYLECINIDTHEVYLKANLIKNGFNARFADNGEIFSENHKLELVTTSFKILYKA
jgi:glycosyltransferase involved in cell wall biosynthesis